MDTQTVGRGVGELSIAIALVAALGIFSGGFTMTPWLISAVVWAAVFGLLCARVATEKGRDSTTWGFLGMALGVFALIALAAVPALPRE